MNHTKYRPFPGLDMPQRKWPNNRITKAPTWCSVDLRDGNQALEMPMIPIRKLAFFRFLVEIGFKEIEVGFPASSDTEFKFTRELIEGSLIPDDVCIQVLTQSRDHIIERTFESLRGVKRAIVHLYNSTSPVQREVVFGKSRDEIIELAVSGARQVCALADGMGPERFTFEYSPESFSQTEPEYAAQICNAVLDVWKDRKVIINLPFTVETATPNIHADQIEYMCARLQGHKNITVSLHAHNDRGTAVAATELGLLAGASRVEGTLFGNGERTGNADIVTLAMNLHSQGIDPGLDFSHIDNIIEVYEKSTGMTVHRRHPYAGDLVYTAFSGSHQDAIRKGMKRMEDAPAPLWQVPSLPIDPCDVGRSYDPIIRVNSQSGGSAMAYMLERHYGMNVPKRMARDFGPVAFAASDTFRKELLSDDVYDLFGQTYINIAAPFELVTYNEKINGNTVIAAVVNHNGVGRDITGEGNGLLDAFCHAITDAFGIELEIRDYSEHSLEHGKKSRAITYIEMTVNGIVTFGAGVSSNITTSSMRAAVSAINRSFVANNRTCTA